MTSKEKQKRKLFIALLLTVLVGAVTLVALFFVFNLYFSINTEKDTANQYGAYYVMITDDPKSSFWQSAYKGAYYTASLQDIYVELLGDNLNENYSTEELMQIAISSHVDGIIVYANESYKMTSLIDEAVDKGIAVVTVYSDNTASKRCSYIGAGGYNIGREYGRQIIAIDKEKRRESIIYEEELKRKTNVAVLIDSESDAGNQNTIITGIRDTLSQENTTNSDYEISAVSVDNSNAFSVEESIRDIFMQNDIPDTIVCLNELDTICAYQAVVDYNKVGIVNILGYYDSDIILNAIDHNVIYATVSIDAEQMGRYCVNALKEFHELGYTSQYSTVDVKFINKTNVYKYLSIKEAANAE